MQVSTTLWCSTSRGSYSTKEVIKVLKDTTNAAKAFKAPPEDSLGTTMPKAVIGSAFIRVRERFVSLIYLLKFFPSIIITVMVGVILKG